MTNEKFNRLLFGRLLQLAINVTAIWALLQLPDRISGLLLIALLLCWQVEKVRVPWLSTVKRFVLVLLFLGLVLHLGTLIFLFKSTWGVRPYIVSFITLLTLSSEFSLCKARLLSKKPWLALSCLLVLPLSVLLLRFQPALSISLSIPQDALLIIGIVAILSSYALPELLLSYVLVAGYLVPSTLIFFELCVPAYIAALFISLFFPFLILILQFKADSAIERGRMPQALVLINITVFLGILQGAFVHQDTWLFAGDKFLQARQPRKALRAYKKALSLGQPKTWHQHLGILQNMANALELQNQYKQSLSYYEEGLALLESEIISHNGSRALSMVNINDAELDLTGIQKEAEWFLLEAKRASLFKDLGSAYAHLGDFQKAIEYGKEALSLLQGGDKEAGVGLLDWCSNFQKQSEGLLKQAESSLAFAYIPLIQQQIDTVKKAHEGLLQEQVIGSIRLGNLYGAYLNQNEQALELYKQSMRAAEALQDVTFRIMVHIAAGGVYNRLARSEEAEQEYNAALSLLSTTKERSLLLLLLQNFGTLERLRGRYDKALTYYQQTLKLLQQSPDTLGEIFTKVGMSITLGELGRSAESLELLQHTLAIAQTIDEKNTLRLVHFYLGKCYEAIKSPRDDEAAYTHYQQSINLLETARLNLLTEPDRIAYLGTDIRIEVYQRMVALCIRQQKFIEGFEYTERGKARAFLDILASADDKRVSAEPLTFSAIQSLLRFTDE